MVHARKPIPTFCKQINYFKSFQNQDGTSISFMEIFESNNALHHHVHIFSRSACHSRSYYCKTFKSIPRGITRSELFQLDLLEAPTRYATMQREYSKSILECNLSLSENANHREAIYMSSTVECSAPRNLSRNTHSCKVESLSNSFQKSGPIFSFTEEQRSRFKPHELKMVDCLLAIMEQLGTYYVSPEDLQQFHKAFPTVTKKTVANLLRRLKFTLRYINEPLCENDIKYIQEFVHKIHEGPIDSDKIRDTIHHLQRKVSIEKQYLQYIIKNELHKLGRKSIHPNDVTYIKQYIQGLTNQSSRTISLSEICNEISQATSLSRYYIMEIVQKEMLKRERKNVSNQQKEYICKLVKELVSVSPIVSIMELCDSIMKHDSNNIISNLSRSLIYELVRTEKRNITKVYTSTEKRKEIIVAIHRAMETILGNSNVDATPFHQVKRTPCKNIVKEIEDQLPIKVHNSEEKISYQTFESNLITSICDIVSSTITFPRHQLYFIVAREVKKLQRANPTDKQYIYEYVVKHNGTYDSIPQLCDEILQTLDLPRSTVYKIIQNVLRKKEKIKVSTETKSFIESFVLEHYDSLTSVSKFCDEMEHKVDIPRAILYEITRQSINRVSRSKIRDIEWKSFISYLNDNENSEDYNLNHMKKHIFNEESLPQGSIIQDNPKEISTDAQHHSELAKMNPHLISQKLNLNIHVVKYMLSEYRRKELKMKIYPYSDK